MLFQYQGCGYPPNVDCQSFFNNFGIPGTTFKCFPSRHDPTMVIIDLNLDQIRRSLVFSLAVPLPCLFLSLAYIVFAYQYLYAKRKQVISINLLNHCDSIRLNFYKVANGDNNVKIHYYILASTAHCFGGSRCCGASHDGYQNS